MSARVRGLTLLIGTLVFGVLLGVLGSGALAQNRARSRDMARRPGGFIEHVYRVIEPRDSAQRAVILPYLEEIEQRNREIIETAREDVRAQFEQLRERLSEVLDEDQMARLEAFERGPPRGRGSGADRRRRSPSGADGRGGPRTGGPREGGPRGDGDRQPGSPPGGTP